MCARDVEAVLFTTNTDFPRFERPIRKYGNIDGEFAPTSAKVLGQTYVSVVPTACLTIHHFHAKVDILL